MEKELLDDLKQTLEDAIAPLWMKHDKVDFDEFEDYLNEKIDAGTMKQIRRQDLLNWAWEEYLKLKNL